MLVFASIWPVAAPFIKMTVILVGGHLLIKNLLKWLDRGLEKTDLDQSLKHFIHKAINIVLHMFVILSALSAIGVSTTGLMAALSAAVVAVAVALRDSLSNVAGGILLLLVPRFATGDYIAAGGDEGTVMDVDLLHTTVRTADFRQVSIPNGVLINSHITNYSREKKRRVDIVFPIPYDADAEKAKKIAMETACGHKLVLAGQDAPFVRISGYEESVVKLTVRCWCETEDYWTVYFDMTEQVRAVLLENGITMPCNRLDVHIKDRI